MAVSAPDPQRRAAGRSRSDRSRNPGNPGRLPGDRDAFAELVVRHYDFIHRVAYRWCGGREDAEDIAQEVCARLGRSIRTFRGDGALTTWLYALTLNVARDFGRRRQRDEAKTRAFGVHALISGEEPSVFTLAGGGFILGALAWRYWPRKSQP